MTSKEKWQYVLSELEKLKDLDARVRKLEGYADSRIKNKQGGGHTKIYTGIPEDKNRPPIEDMGK